MKSRTTRVSSNVGGNEMTSSLNTVFVNEIMDGATLSEGSEL